MRGEIAKLNKIAKSCGGFILFLALLALCVPAVRAQDTAEANYKSKCAGCHGPDGTGSTPAGKAHGRSRLPFTRRAEGNRGGTRRHTITNGKNKMPKYAGKLKDSEIKDLAAYVHGSSERSNEDRSPEFGGKPDLCRKGSLHLSQE